LRPNALGDIFQKQMRPTPKKYRPNGEIPPNLVTLYVNNALGVTAAKFF
jgi:hypothetical protein